MSPSSEFPSRFFRRFRQRLSPCRMGRPAGIRLRLYQKASCAAALGAFEDRSRPIIFFHAEKPSQLRLTIDFPGGMAGVWFPATERPAIFANTKQPKVGGTLEWNLESWSQASSGGLAAKKLCSAQCAGHALDHADSSSEVGRDLCPFQPEPK